MRPISICVIAKSEEKHMHNFLTHICRHTKGYPVEILIADTGSEDRTKEIASSFPVKLLDFAWCNDFSAARNFTLQQAANDWVLVLDCDEYLEKLDMDALQYFCDRHADCVGLIELHNHYPSDTQSYTVTDYLERFFNRRYFHYESAIHEQVRAIDGSALKRVQLPVSVQHHGYSGTMEELSAKVGRNNQLLLDMLKEHPGDPYLYFQLGQGAYILKDFEAACEYYGAGLGYNVDPKALYVQMMVENYGYSLLETKQYEAALQFENIYEEFATDADFVFLMGYIYMQTGNIPQAMAEFQKATTFQNARKEGANSFLPLYNLGVIYECMGQLKEALTCYRKCKEFEPARSRIQHLSNTNG